MAASTHSRSSRATRLAPSQDTLTFRHIPPAHATHALAVGSVAAIHQNKQTETPNAIRTAIGGVGSHNAMNIQAATTMQPTGSRRLARSKTLPIAQYSNVVSTRTRKIQANAAPGRPRSATEAHKTAMNGTTSKAWNLATRSGRPCA